VVRRGGSALRSWAARIMRPIARPELADGIGGGPRDGRGLDGQFSAPRSEPQPLPPRQSQLLSALGERPGVRQERRTVGGRVAVH
jgi:hypothetical protein